MNFMEMSDSELKDLIDQAQAELERRGYQDAEKQALKHAQERGF